MRNLLTILAVMACLASICALLVQRQNLNSLRAVQPQPSAAAEPTGDSAREPRAQVSAARPESELLQLRSEVTRLKARQRELAGVAAEADRLRGQIASSPTNASGGVPLPPGYIRKTEARMVGYSTPESTIESFLWALQNHDINNLLKALSASAAQDLQAQIQRSGQKPEEFFKNTDALPGLAIRSQQTLSDGSVAVLLEAAPGMPPEKIVMQLVNGEWKMNTPL